MVAVAVVFAGCAPSDPAPTGTAPDGTMAMPKGKGAGAPAFAVETFAGETFSLTDHRGTPIVINFWESW